MFLWMAGGLHPRGRDAKQADTGVRRYLYNGWREVRTESHPLDIIGPFNRRTLAPTDGSRREPVRDARLVTRARISAVHYRQFIFCGGCRLRLASSMPRCGISPWIAVARQADDGTQ